jgi:hypothetical protein
VTVPAVTTFNGGLFVPSHLRSTYVDASRRQDALMREEFERQGDVWENGRTVDDILEQLKAKFADSE